MTFDPRDADPLTVEPDDERIPSSKPYRLVPDSPRRGCSVLPFLVLILAVVAALNATPRPAQPVEVPVWPRQQVAPVTAERTGAPLRLGDDAERASHESFGLWVAPAPGPRGPARDAGSEETRQVSPAEFDLATGFGQLGGAPPSMPAHSGGIGTALWTTTATWCAPTPTMCQGWGPNARYAALPSYQGIPYRVRVSYRGRSVVVLVVSILRLRHRPRARSVPPTRAAEPGADPGDRRGADIAGAACHGRSVMDEIEQWREPMTEYRTLTRDALATALPAALEAADDAGSVADDWIGSEYVDRMADAIFAALPPSSDSGLRAALDEALRQHEGCERAGNITCSVLDDIRAALAASSDPAGPTDEQRRAHDAKHPDHASTSSLTCADCAALSEPKP